MLALVSQPRDVKGTEWRLDSRIHPLLNNECSATMHGEITAVSTEKEVWQVSSHPDSLKQITVHRPVSKYPAERTAALVVKKVSGPEYGNKAPALLTTRGGSDAQASKLVEVLDELLEFQ